MSGCGGCLPTSPCLQHWAADAWHELKGQPFRDDAFTEQQWQEHLTWRRYIPELRTLGIVILSLAPIWGWSVFVAMCVGLYATFAEPAGAPSVSHHPELITPFTITSFALSLLMLFKTTSSYGRWWEARTLWGSGYLTVRSILRLCISYVGRDSPELVPALYRWTAAILPSLAAYLRMRQHYFDDHLAPLLAAQELEWLRQRGIPPVAALQVLSRLLDQAKGLSDIERQQIEALLSHCDVIVGGCERILRQPIPYAWNRHTHRFILVFVTFLPFPFWHYFGWATLPIMGVLTFLLCGVENIGVQIEEPHRVLPLNQICAGTLRALRLMMSDRQDAADMAAVASIASTGSQSAVAVTMGNGCSGAAAAAAAAAAGKAPLPAVITLRRSGKPAADGLSPAEGAAGDRPVAVELSPPSAGGGGGATPSTARPQSPDVPDAFAP